MANVVQWRAFVGPRWLDGDHARFWDWASTITYGAAYEPLTDMPPTTLSSGITAASTSLSCADTSGWPSTGGCWVGPNDSGESWEYMYYGTNSANTLSSLSRYTEDSEFSGTHTSGATVRFWWELTGAFGTVDISEFMDRTLSVVDWTARLSGVNMPQAALINDHIILIQVRQLSGSAWGDWTNELLGWIDAPEVQDDYKRRKEWSIRVRSSYGYVGTKQVDGVQAGQTELTRRVSASASSSLANPYKAYNLGEFLEAEPALDAQSAMDTSLDTLWMSERYIGETNTAANPGDANDAVATGANALISQVHITRYPGQGPGYRWIEIVILDTIGNFEIMYSTDVGTGPGTYTADYWFRIDGSSYSAGDKIIIAENAALFEAENPDHDAAAVLEGLTANTAITTQFRINADGATSGGFQIEYSESFNDSDSIAYNATAAQVNTALGALSNVGSRTAWGGPLPSAPVYVSFHTNGSGIYYRDLFGSLGIKSGYTLDVTPTLTEVATGNDSASSPAGDLTMVEWFDVLSLGKGVLTLLEGFDDVWSTLRWGTADKPPCVGDAGLWTNTNTVAPSGIAAPNTLRMIYAPSSPTEPADFWEVGVVHTPGYEANGNEWLLFRRPQMGLRLLEDISDSYTGVVSVGDLSGATVPDGIANSGTTTLQIGLEQISVTRSGDTITITARGANSTTAAAHVTGDVIYVVESSVAVDAFPMTDITIKRLNTTVPAIYNAKIYGSRYRQVRTPDQDAALTDWTQIGSDISANTSQDVTRTISATRYQWILIVITAMETQPYRACINGVEIVNDSGVYNADRILSSADAADVVAQVLTNGGLPSSCITDNGSTSSVDNLTTSADYAAAVASDLAELTRTRITVDRCSAIDLDPDPIFDGTTSYPSAAGTLDNGDLIDWNFEWDWNRTISQVELLWKDTSGVEQDSVVFPSTPSTDGRKVRVGPYIYANSTAAAAGAEKIYYTRRVPFDISTEIADIGRTYRPGQVYTFTWPVDSSMSAMSRKGVIISADHRIGNGRWQTVVHALQLGRTDRR